MTKIDHHSNYVLRLQVTSAELPHTSSALGYFYHQKTSKRCLAGLKKDGRIQTVDAGVYVTLSARTENLHFISVIRMLSTTAEQTHMLLVVAFSFQSIDPYPKNEFHDF